MIDQKLIELRRIVHSRRKVVVDTFLNDHSAEKCILCGTCDDLTKQLKGSVTNGNTNDFVLSLTPFLFSFDSYAKRT